MDKESAKREKWKKEERKNKWIWTGVALSMMLYGAIFCSVPVSLMPVPGGIPIINPVVVGFVGFVLLLVTWADELA